MPAEEQALIVHVQSYMRAVNAVHQKHFSLTDPGSSSLPGSDFCKELELVREHYLVPKKRDWIGGIFDPPPYSEAETPDTAFEAELVSEKRGIVTVLTGGRLDFRFSLQRRKEGWRISAMSQRYHSPDRSVEYRWVWTDR